MTTSVDGTLGIVTTGNVTANNIFGNLAGNVNINGNIAIGENLTAAGNITGENLTSNGVITLGATGGNLQLKAIDANTFGVFKADGVTQANIDVGNVDATQISQGNSIVAFTGIDGNAYVAIDGANIVTVTSSGTTLDGRATINAESGNAAIHINVAENSIHPASIYTRVSRGTLAAPTASQAGDQLFVINTSSFTNFGVYQEAGSIQVLANGPATSSTSYAPSIVQLTSTNSAGYAWSLQLDDNGNLIIPGRVSQHMYNNSANPLGYVVGRARGSDDANIAPIQSGDTLERVSVQGYTGNGTTTIDGVPGWSYAGGTQYTAVGLPSGPGQYVPSEYTIKTVDAGNIVNTFTFDTDGNLQTDGIKTDNYYYANGAPVDFQQAAGNAYEVQFNNGSDNFDASSAFVFDPTSNTLTVTGNITAPGGSGSTNQVIFNKSGNLAGDANLQFDGNNMTISGNLSVGGNVNATGNINVISGNSASFFGSIPAGFGALYAGAPLFTPVGNSIAQYGADYNGYAQVNLENINPGPQASGDYVITADAGTDTQNYINMGITSSTWDGTATNSLGNALDAMDGYLYVNTGNLVLGTSNTGTSLKVISGSSNSTGIVADFGATALEMSANIIPSSDNTYTLGNSTRSWQALYVSGNTIYLNNIPVKMSTATQMTVAGGNVVTQLLSTGNTNITNAVVTGNIVSSSNGVYSMGTSGSQFLDSYVSNSLVLNNTALTVVGSTLQVAGANVVVQSPGGNTDVGNLDATGNISATGNITGGNISTGGDVDATGNIAAGGDLSATGNIAGGNISTTGDIDATGNVTGTLLYSSGNVAAAGNVNGANLNTSGAVNATGNIVGGNLSTTGLIYADGNITGGNLVSSANISATGNINGGNVIAIGNVNGGNIRSEGLFFAVGNITGANLITSGGVFADGDITGGNISTTGDMSASGELTVIGNIAGGNLTTSGVVLALGNVSGANLNTAGIVSAAGNVSGGNLTTSGNITASGDLDIIGNITGGNLITSGNAFVDGILTDNYYYANGDPITLVTAAAGSNTQVQFNNNGAFDADANLSFDVTTGALTVGGNIIGSSELQITGAASLGDTLSVVGNANVGNIGTVGIVVSGTADIATLDVSGEASVTGNLTVDTDINANANIELAGNLNITGNISQVTAQTARIFGDATTGIQALRAGVITGFANLATSVIQASTNNNDYSQINQQNVNGGNVASADYVITANDGDDTNYFLDMGLAGSGWDGTQTNSLGNAVGPHDGYLYINQGNLVVGIESAGKTVKVLVGASDSTGIVATFNPPATPSTTTGTGSLVLGGGLGVSGNINAQQVATTGNISAAGTITATGNVSGGNITTGGVVAATGNISGSNVVTAGNVVANNVSIGNNATVTGNVTTDGILTDNYYYANGNPVDFQQPGGANIQVQYNDDGDFGGSADFTFNSATNVLTVNGNVNAGNLTVTEEISTGTLLATGNANVGNIGTTDVVATGAIDAATLNITSTSVFGDDVEFNGNLDAGTGNLTVGNIVLSGNINITGNITQVSGNSGQFFGNTTTGLAALYAGLPTGYTTVPSSVFQVATNLDDYTQVNQQNINGGAQASADYVITADNGDDTNFFLDIGLAGSGWDGTQTNSLGNALAPNDGYGYVKDGNFVIGAPSTGKTVKILAGTSDATGVVATFNAPGTVSTSSTTGALVLTGGLGVSGKLTAGNIAATTFTGNLVGNVTGNISGNLTSPGANTQVIFNDDGTANAVPGMTFDKSTNLMTVTGNIAGGNLTTAGVVAATGNVSGGNLNTAGLISATGNITGGNITTGGVVVATGNVTAANVTTGGVVVATGNITGANLVTAGNVYATTALVANAITGNGSSVTITATGTDQNVVLDPSGTGVVSVSSARITNLAAPVADSDAATKAYVDGAVQGLNVKASCEAATVTSLPSYSYNNGASGVGATVTALAVGVLTIDGYATKLGDRILVKNEVGGLNVVNGIYSVTTEGTAGAAFVLTRTTDFNTPAEIPSSFTFIISGTTNADTGWVCTTNAPITIGTTPIAFTQFSGAGSYTAGPGIALNGGAFSANVDGITTAIVSGNIVVPTGATLTNPNITAATGTSITLTGNANVANLNATTAVTAPSLVSNVAVGTAPLTVTSTTRVANLSVAYANVSDYGVVTTQSTGTFYPTFVGSAATGNAALASNTALSFNAATGALNSTLLGGTLTTAAQPNVTSLGSLTSLTVTGNASAGNIATLGAISATGNISGGNITTGGLILATGNVTGGNLTTSGVVSASGNVTSGANISAVNFAASGNATITGNISAGNASITANLGLGNINATGQVIVAGNITSTSGFIVGDGGFLSNLTVAAGTAIVNGTSNISIPAPNGNINFSVTGAAAGRLSATSVALGVGAGAAGGFSTAIGSGAGGVSQSAQAVAIGYNAGATGQGTGAVAIGALAGQTNQTAGSIAINATGTSLNTTGAGLFINPVRSDSGNVTSPMFYNASTNELTYSTAMSLTGNVVAGNVYANSGTIGATTLAGSLSTAAQPNVTSVGTLSALAVTANVIAGNVYANSGTIGATTLTGTLSTAAQTNITSVGTLSALAVTANVTAGNVYANSGTIGAGTLAGTLSTAAQTNITSVGTLSSLNVSGLTTTGSLNTNNITTGSAGTAGTLTGTWSLGVGSTLQSTYSDLGERYSSDFPYEPGTVLMIGGTAETTLATREGRYKVAGVVSTEPAYILNGDLKNSVILALAGRVPCRVVGIINKGDILTVSDVPGVAASAIGAPEYGTIIGRALESYNSTEVGVIEIKVDRG